MAEHRIYDTPFGDVYALYVAKLERKGRDTADLDVAIEWLTGFGPSMIRRHIDERTTFRDFFGAATINPNASLITGRICGVVIQDLDDPLMRNIRYLDKLVDEIANGRPMEKVLRKP